MMFKTVLYGGLSAKTGSPRSCFQTSRIPGGRSYLSTLLKQMNEDYYITEKSNLPQRSRLPSP